VFRLLLQQHRQRHQQLQQLQAFLSKGTALKKRLSRTGRKVLDLALGQQRPVGMLSKLCYGKRLRKNTLLAFFKYVDFLQLICGSLSVANYNAYML